MPKVEPRNVSPVIGVIRDVLLGVRYWNQRGKKLILKVKKSMLGTIYLLKQFKWWCIRTDIDWILILE